MCNQLQMLGELSGRRFLARCEHGTYHLGWEGAVWLLTAGEVRQLRDFLTLAGGSEVTLQSPLSFMRHPAGHVSMWFGARGLSLSAHELPAFLELLRSGTERRNLTESVTEKRPNLN